jgi:hypothetical protein
MLIELTQSELKFLHWLVVDEALGPNCYSVGTTRFSEQFRERLLSKLRVLTVEITRHSVN